MKHTNIKYMTANETMTIEEANERLAEFGVDIFQNDRGRYTWYALMAES